MTSINPVTSIIIDNWKTPPKDESTGETPYSHGERVERAYFDSLERTTGRCLNFHTTQQGFDANNDGTLSADEQALEVLLSGNDTNNNGTLDDDEVIHRLIRIKLTPTNEQGNFSTQHSVIQAYNMASTLVSSHDISAINCSHGLQINRGFTLGPARFSFDYKNLTLEKARAYAHRHGSNELFRSYGNLVAAAERNQTAIFQTASNDALRSMRHEQKKASLPLLQTFFHKSPSVTVVGNNTFGQQRGVELRTAPGMRMGDTEDTPIAVGNSFATPQYTGVYDAQEMKDRGLITPGPADEK